MFSKKWRLFRLFGFDVGIDASWILLALLVTFTLATGYFPFKYAHLSGGTYWLMGISGALGLFFSIVVHEFFHSLVAKRRGLPMNGITLFIFGGVSEMNDEPKSPGDEFFIAIVGPLSSLVLAGLFFGLSETALNLGLATALQGLMYYLATINFLLAVFNMVPAFPMDGGRVLRAALWRWTSDLHRATRTASAIGSGFGILMILFGVFEALTGAFIGGMWLVLIGLFIRSAAGMSYKQLRVRRALEGESLKRFIKQDIAAASPELTLNKLVEEYVYRYHDKLYPVVEGDQLKGCVFTNRIKSTNQDQWDRVTVSEVLEPCAGESTIDPDTDAMEALSAMRRNNISRLMVTRDGRLLGMIALKDMLDFLSMKMEMEQA